MADNGIKQQDHPHQQANICPNCAQPLSPTKLDWRFVIEEARMVIDLDKGILYTIKEVLLRPGASIRHYLNVDRSKFMRPFLFLFILSAISTFVTNPKDEQDDTAQPTIAESVNSSDESDKSGKNTSQAASNDAPPSEITPPSETRTQTEFKGIELNFVTADEDQSPTQTKLHSILKQVFKWSSENSGWTAVFIVVVFTPWIKLFFKNSPYNSIEIAIMFCYISGVTVTIAMFGALIQYAFRIEAYSIGRTISNLYTIWAIGQFFEVSWKGYIKVAFAYTTGMVFFVGSTVGLALLAIHFNLIG